MSKKTWKFRLQKYAVPVSFFLIFAVLVYFFHRVMTPFIIALIVVYLMEPLVCRMSALKIRKKTVPRGISVITVYLLFFSTIVGLGFALIPPITYEIGQATDALPKYINTVKNEKLPDWSARIDKFFYSFNAPGKKNARAAITATRNFLHSAVLTVETDNKSKFAKEDLPPVLCMPPFLVPYEIDQYISGGDEGNALFKIKKSKGGFEIYPSDNLKIAADAQGLHFKLNEQQRKITQNNVFNLERELNRSTLELLESGTQYAGSALTVLQYLFTFLINAFVQLILVFMLAAFISIDLPNIISRVRSVFEDNYGEAKAFDDLMQRYNFGLSGVIRGQIIICIINGTLTGIGLWILGVDFALLMGILAGVLTIIPIFGTIISAVPAVLLGLVQGFSTALFVLGWILFVHFLDANFFTPKIVGFSSNLHPVVIIFSIVAGQHAFGVLGIILAIPVAAILKITVGFILEVYRRINRGNFRHHQRSDSLPEIPVTWRRAATLQSVVSPVEEINTEDNTILGARIGEPPAPEHDEQEPKENSNEKE